MILVLYFSHYLISIKFEAVDEIMTKVKHQFWEVKINFKTINSSKKSYILKNLFNTGPGCMSLQVRVLNEGPLLNGRMLRKVAEYNVLFVTLR